MAYTTLIKPCGGDCNYRCTHCFYKPISTCNATMTLSSVDIVLHRLGELPHGSHVQIVFQGGEPTLAGLDYYIYFTDKASTELAHLSISYSLQTNGSLLTKAWMPMLKRYNFLVGLSLDGDRSINNRYRLRADLNGSYDDIMTAARLLEKSNVDYNILTVITRDICINPMRVLSHYIGKGFRHIQFTMPVVYENNRDFMPTSAEMHRFLCDCFIEYNKRIFTPNAISIRYYDNILSLLATGHAEQCGLCGLCSPYLVINPNLDCYPCDFYATSEYLLGNLHDNSIAELTDSHAYHSFITSGASAPTACATCSLIGVCGGGCKRYRGFDTSTHDNEHYYCDAIKAFFSVHGVRLSQLALQLSELKQ